MKKGVKRLASAVGTAVLAANMMLTSVPVFAAGITYTPINGTTTTFDKYLVMDEGANVPNVKFTYTIEAGTAIDPTEEKFAVQPGVEPEKVTMTDEDTTTDGYQIKFQPGDTTQKKDPSQTTDPGSSTDDGELEVPIQDDLESGPVGGGAVLKLSTDADLGRAATGDQVKGDLTGKKYAKKAVTVDFTGCSFSEPGIYRYKITESGTNQGVTNDSNRYRYLDVYVEDKNDGSATLQITKYVLHATATEVIFGADGNQLQNGANADGTDDFKSQGYTNTYDTSDLTISKTVTGNQGSRDKYFKFTVAITGAVAGTKYTVDLTGAEQNPAGNTATKYTGMTNPTEITVGADGTISTDFYLQNGQNIVIKGIAKDTNYTVTEAEEDYKPSFVIVGACTPEPPINGDPLLRDASPRDITGSANTTGEQIIESNDVAVNYTNTRQGTVPTGVIMTVAPFAAITLLGGFGVAKIVAKKKKEDEEE